METIEYPLLFEPLYETGDGQGDMLLNYLEGNRDNLPHDRAACSWEVVDAGESNTRVVNGPLRGETLGALVKARPDRLVGRRHHPDDPFPLCLRLLQTAVDRPLGVFPEPAGRSRRHEVRSNFRFWYSLDAGDEAVVISGIKPGASRLKFMQHLNSVRLRDCLQVYHPETHSAFFAPSGRVHALGRDNLVIEIQQRPGEPWPVSGWGADDAVSTDDSEKAMDMVNFHDRQIRRIAKDVRPVKQTRRIPLVPRCPAFQVDEIQLCDPLGGRTSGDTFHLLVLVHGQATLECRGNAMQLKPAQPALIPACLGDYRVSTNRDAALLLRASLPV